MIVIAAGAVLGGADRLCGNRLGYGDKFEEAFRLLGPMALSMAGMICLAPVLAGVLGRVIVPFYRGLGVDPAMFGGVLAIDMGGYQLAKELAADGRMGSYAGIVVSALFGCTLVFTIPVGMGMIPKEDRRFLPEGSCWGYPPCRQGFLRAVFCRDCQFRSACIRICRCLRRFCFWCRGCGRCRIRW